MSNWSSLKRAFFTESDAICTQKCSWHRSCLYSHKLCGKYVKVRRPERLDYDHDGPMWSVKYINAGNQTLKRSPFLSQKDKQKTVALKSDVTRGDNDHASWFVERAFFIKTRRNKGYCKKYLCLKCFEQIAMLCRSFSISSYTASVKMWRNM